MERKFERLNKLYTCKFFLELYNLATLFKLYDSLMADNNFGFEELFVWQKARVFKNDISVLVKVFPKEEKYRITDQIIRSTRSINALIAEGHGRFSYPDRIHFCIQARGSLSETVNHLIDAYDEKLISEKHMVLIIFNFYP